MLFDGTANVSNAGLDTVALELKGKLKLDRSANPVFKDINLKAPCTEVSPLAIPQNYLENLDAN